MYSKKIRFVCFATLGIALHGQVAMAQLPPISGAVLHLDAALGVTLDGSNNVTNWDNQLAGAHPDTNFELPTTPINPGPITVNSSAFPAGTPGLTFGVSGATRLESGPWLDYDSGYTIFAVVNGDSCCVGGGSIFIAEVSVTNKMGFNLHGSTDSVNLYARNDGNTLSFIGGTNLDGGAPTVFTARLDTTPGSEVLELYQDGIFQISDTGAYGTLDNPAIPVRIGADFATTSTFMVGDIGEVVYFNRPLNPTEMGQMQTYLDGKHFGPPLPPTNTFNWNGGGLADWGDSGNWSPVGGSAPQGPRANDPNHTAIFPDTITEATNVSTMDAVTVNRIEFNNGAHGVIVSGLGSVNMASQTESPFDTPTMSVVGSHEFQAAVNLENPTTIDVASSSQLVFGGALNLGGNTLTKTGLGTIAVNNILASGGGSLNCDEGTCSGSGTIDGSVNNNGGTVAPGNSPGILTIEGNYTQGTNGTLALEIGGLVPGDDHDKLVVNGIATLAGTLDVTLINGFTLAGDMLFDVLDFNSVVNDFTTFNLPTGLVWNVSDGSLCFGTCTGGGLTDYDNDGTWGLGDLNLVLFNWNEDGASLPPAWLNSRPSAGTLVGLPELNQVLFSWGQPGSLATVPEPGSVLLSIVGMLGAVGFFRRRSRTYQRAV
jgi:hypothetical protein